MSTEPQSTRQTNDLRPEKTIFWPAVLSIVLISLPMLIYPKASEEIIGAIYQPFAAKFGALYLWITVGLIGLCIYFACSRYGDIKFGEADVLARAKNTSVDKLRSASRTKNPSIPCIPGSP